MKKLRLFIFISWLWARLKWTVELSRLTIVRFLPNKQIHYVAYKSNLPSPTFWICEHNQISCIKVSQLQLDNINTGRFGNTIYLINWKKDEDAIWALECN